MRFHAVTLENIRSYTQCTITLPAGTVLLSGDIGSGKTTILLAIEFALFGIQRGLLSGGTLLRHGAREGSVTLEATIGGKRIVIRRVLKRTASGVTQDAGSLTIDGAVFEGTAQELKARILSLLGYPPSLLTKRGLLFRYTVYTPQEEMRAILAEKADDRLETLRKLFAIDAYKRARDNAVLLVRELRRETAALQQRIKELGEETADREALERRARELETKAATLQRAVAEGKQTIATHEERLERLERERFEREELLKQRAVKRARAESMQSRLADFDERLARLDARITEGEKQLAPACDEDALLKTRAAHERQAQLIAEKRRAIERQRARHRTLIEEDERTVRHITELDACPTCRQNVPREHKERVEREARARIAAAREKLRALDELEQQLAQKEKLLARRREENEQQLRLLDANKERRVQLERLRADHARLLEERAAFLRQRESLLAEIQELEQRLRDAPVIDDAAYKEEKQALQRARAAQEDRVAALAGVTKEQSFVTRELERLARWAAERERAVAALEKKQRTLNWLGTQFVGTAHAVERAIFMNIYGLFDEYFRDWFSILIEDETLRVRLDHDFSPVIVQNGYETGLAHLSGGERTSVALAYRLALNRVVNEFLDGIKTRGVLILDEPTDGFSSEQLDRVREVLDRLALEQVIIVSHEPQMEGFVDHVVRIEKRAHESVAL